MDELLAQFLIEAPELAQQLAEALLALERAPGPGPALDAAFRHAHTLKGSVQLFDLPPLAGLLHAAEDLLGSLRAGDRAPDGAALDALLAAAGAVEGWIMGLAGEGAGIGLPAGATTEGARHEAALRALLDGPAAPLPAEPPAGLAWLPALLAEAADPLAEARAASLPVTALQYRPAADCFFLGDDPFGLLRRLPGLVALRVTPRAAWNLGNFDPFACNLDFAALSTASPEALRQHLRFVADQVEWAPVVSAAAAEAGATPTVAATRDPGQRLLRVEAGRIDGMMDMVAELVVAKTGLAGLAREAGGAATPLGRALAARQAELDRLVAGLHRAVLGLRLVPLAQGFRRLPRLARELAAQLGKPVALEMAGEEIEADKSVVDALAEPLLHLLRNAIDHGIEPPAARQAAGKPATGRITLAARRLGDQIQVTLADDGAGLDPAKLRRIAGERGLLPAAELAALDEAAAMALIFRPGFSTAAAVTGISGRGVGMDAVRAAIEALGGRVAVASRPGQGSSFRLTLPRATVITRVILLRLGEARFGVPIEAVAETLRLPEAAITPLAEGEAFVLRGRALPLLRLSDLLGLPAAPRGAERRVLVTASASGAAACGIEVDGFAERVDVMLRPMGGLLAGLPGALGTALLGDGAVLVVLDLDELAGAGTADAALPQGAPA
ncbi:chemotaxis protein CheA [Roseomonas sp. 18066]|uniref:chemotaxis protein CheA n=1 Tax=Roseomonas sp. 18066 TaxID=2681412 RepID=UPI001358273D|nr:chemotaxis protein CheA [Roseomonas sp. 18066]